MNKLILALPLAVSLYSAASSATVVEYNFEGDYDDRSIHDLMTFSNQGVSVDVTAWSVENDGEGNISTWNRLSGNDTGVFYKYDDDLGVKSSVDDGYNLDGGDSVEDLDEGLLFTFENLVTLDFIDFDSWDGDDHSFNLTVDGVTILTDVMSGILDNDYVYSGTGNDDDYFYFSGITGSEFFFWADDNDNDSSFRVDDLQVTSVPEPSILALFMLGMTGIYAQRRRVKSNS